MPEELWMEVRNIVKESKKGKKAKWLSEETLQIAEKRREVKGKGEKERYIHWNSEFQRISRRDKKAFLRINIVKMAILPKQSTESVQSYQATNGIFHRTRTNNFTICMEIQKTSNSQSNLEKEEWNWRNQPA